MLILDLKKYFVLFHNFKSRKHYFTLRIFLNIYFIFNKNFSFSNLVELRKTYGEQFQKRHNLKLGFMSAFVKATAAALQDQPIVNAGNYLFFIFLKYAYFFLSLNTF